MDTLWLDDQRDHGLHRRAIGLRNSDQVTIGIEHLIGKNDSKLFAVDLAVATRAIWAMM